jgi:transcriptional regulator with XRE-family HTH domain
MKLGQTFKDLREKKNISLLGVHTLCTIEISLEKLHDFECGDVELSKEELEGVCDLLMVTPPELALRSLESEDIPEEKEKAWERLKPLLDNMFQTLDDLRNANNC